METNLDKKAHFDNSSFPSVGLAYFLKYYWNERDIIFNELYKILYNTEPPIKEEEIKNSHKYGPSDDFSDLKYYVQYPECFKCFEDTKLRTSLGLDYDDDDELKNKKNEEENKNNDENNEDESEKKNDEVENKNNDENNIDEFENEIDEDESNDEDFIIKTKKKIFKNYSKNYIGAKYKFKNKDFSLSSDTDKVIYFQIKNINIFQIDYLVTIKINANAYEWVCNSYYGFYLLYKIKGIKKPYPVYSDKNEDIEIKTISNLDDFDDLMSKGINEFVDLNYEINLDLLAEESRKYYELNSLKKTEKYNQMLNLDEQASKIGNFHFLEKLFTKKNISENSIYIYASKNYMNTEKILNTILGVNNKNIGRFLYLDFEYMDTLKSRSDLKKYFAFWLYRAFRKWDFEEYKTFYLSNNKSISFGNYSHIIKSLIEFNQETYDGENLFIILNNVKSEKHHSIINNIKQSIKNEFINYKLLIFCNMENEYNFKIFDEIYKNPDIKLILIPDLIFDGPLSDAGDKIKNIFFKYDPNKFADLIKLFHFSSFMDYKSKKENNDFEELSLIKNYIQFIKLNIDIDLDETKPFIKNIEFKNKEIEKHFSQQYGEFFATSIETEENLQAVLNLNDGDLFEKIIILDIITRKIEKDYNFNILEVNSLFGLELKDLDLEKYKGKNILFIQKNKTAEIFDFGILINKDGQIVMKLYQVSTKKEKPDLERLDVDIVKLHCVNIKKNLQTLGVIKNFSFGIITSDNCYQENKSDFETMKDDCVNKGFEILIYNIKKKKFYTETNDINNNNDNFLLIEKNIFSVNEKNYLDLPNYENFFQLKPRLISMKYINKNYNNYIGKYYNKNYLGNDIKIIGKIEYNQSLFNYSIKENNLGMLICGNIPRKMNDKEKRTKDVGNTKIRYRIIKENGRDNIYKKDPKDNYVDIVHKLDSGLKNAHLLLYKYNEQKFLSKKRNPDYLFLEDIISQKNKNN